MKQNYQQFGPDFKNKQKNRPKAGFFGMKQTGSVLNPHH